MKKTVLAIIAVSLSGIGFSQQNKEEIPICSTSAKQQEIFDKNSGIETLYLQNQLLRNSIVNNEQKADSTLYIIPVVFHVLHEYGIENISDAQVYDALRVLNEEFGGNDPDSIFIVPQFKPLNANTFIEFRLASIDPEGNCTNGIEHIYSHETRNGDDYSKIHQWDRSHYLNIWTSEITNPGSASYTYEPVLTNGNNFWIDGIMVMHNYAGSVGTSSSMVEHTLTHQTGHYLGLEHLFGAIANFGTVCGDDGIGDTPVTKGWYCTTDTTVLKDCDPNIVEDVNNYMELHYCLYHFTAGQGDYMHNTLQNSDGERNVLSQNSTLTSTGVINSTMPQSPLTVPLCAPVSDFNAAYTRACQGAAVNFNDASWNAVIDNWEWTFEDGSPATSVSQNPTVVFNTSGWKDITLIVSNSAGSDTLTLTDYIYISPDWADFVGPGTLDIEGTQHWLFVVENPENDEPRFTAVDGIGYDGSKAFKLNNYKDVSGAVPFSDDYFYYNRLGKSQDRIMTPSYDLTYTTDVTVGFWYAYASMATQQDNITAILKVYSSRNCGEQWITRLNLLDTALITAGINFPQEFIPNDNTEWKYAEFSYFTNTMDNRTRFMFEFEASDSSNNLYIDKISVNGILSTDVIGLEDWKFTVYPNPNIGQEISIEYPATGDPVTFTITDLSGKVILKDSCEKTQGDIKFQLQGSKDLLPACYLLIASSGKFRTVQKIVKLN